MVLADLDLLIGHPRRVLGGRRQCHGAGQEQAAEQARKHAAPGVRRSGDEISDQWRRRCGARVPGGYPAASPKQRAETKRVEKRDEITSRQRIGLHWPAPSRVGAGYQTAGDELAGALALSQSTALQSGAGPGASPCLTARFASAPPKAMAAPRASSPKPWCVRSRPRKFQMHRSRVSPDDAVG